MQGFEVEESAYWTPAGLARHLDMSEKWVEKHTQARRIPGQTKMGGAWRYHKAAVQKALLSGQLLLPDPKKAKRPAA
jgi:hypothetical protein